MFTNFIQMSDDEEEEEEEEPKENDEARSTKETKTDRNRNDIVVSLVSEIVLCTKEANTKTRATAYELLVQV